MRAAVQRLGTIGWSRLASGPGSRTAKYRQLFDEALGLDAAETAVLAVLMLRGPQTLGELKTRTERLHRFADVGEVDATLSALDGRELAHRLERRPGEREERWTHLLADGPTGGGPVEEPHAAEGEETTVERRLARVEARLEELERTLAQRGVLD